MSDIYFVLNGYLNGEAGTRAAPAGGGGDPTVQADGWYFLLPGDADGRGPYPTRDDAEAALRDQPAWYVGVENGDGTISWDRALEADEPDGDVLVRVDWVRGSGPGSSTPDHWRVEMEGGYDCLRVETSVSMVENALRAFGAAYDVVSDLLG